MGREQEEPISILASLVFVAASFLESIFGAICGIFGGMVGRKCSVKMNNAGVDKFLAGLMVAIIGMSAYNAWRYAI